MCHTRILPNSDSAINSSPDEIGGHFSASSVHGDGHTRGDTAAGGGRLGNMAVFVTPPTLPEVEHGVKVADDLQIHAPKNMVMGLESQRKRDRFRLQRVAVGILGDSWQVANCNWHPYAGDFDGVQGGVSIKRAVHPDGTCGRSYYGGLMTCGSVWTCPVCSLKIAAKRAEELAAAIDTWKDRDGYLCMVTATIQHRHGDRLEALIGDLKAAMEYQRRGAAKKRFDKRFGLRGHVRSTEIRFTLQAGWHPHIHEILFMDRPPDLEEIQSAYMSRYGEKLEEMGYHTVDGVTVRVTADKDQIKQYLAKFALELTCGQMKDGRKDDSFSPFQLLSKFEETGKKWFAQRFHEYAEATKGRNWFTWSRVSVGGGKTVSFYNWLTGVCESSDEEVAEDEGGDDTETLVTLTKDEWYRLREKHLRASALAVADDDAERLRQWLIEQGVISPDPVDWLRRLVGMALTEAEAARARRAILHHDLGSTYAVTRADWGWSGAVPGPWVLESVQSSGRVSVENTSGDGPGRVPTIAQIALI